MHIFKSETISCKPISTFEDLIQWSPDNHNSRKFKIEKFKPSYYKNDQTKQILVCHDMKNNYLEDKYFQGSNVSNCYSFYHWNLIDIFIYFSHHFVTIPPESWINAAHENNVRMLGTFITEFTDGEKICEKLFENIDEAVKKLIEITVYYGFDGWLINIENKIANMDKLKLFVKTLTDELKKLNKDLYKVIWYDSVIETGELKWQNELNDLNKYFFDITDGFFVNYTWKESNLVNSKLNGGDRHTEVYVGVDVFGRGCLGDGGFNCNIAFEEIHKHDLSFALFAPGWLHECNDTEKFIENSEKFWSFLAKYTNRKKVSELPFITSFSHSSGKNLYLNGKKISSSDNEWNSFNLQSLLPILSDSDNSIVKWCFEDAFYGGSCIHLSQNSSHKLFDLNINLKDNEFYVFEYVFKLKDETEPKSELNKFYLTFEYNDQNSVSKKIDFNFKMDDSCDEFKILESLKETTSLGWHIRRYLLKVTEHVTLTSLTAFNKFDKDQPSKIGLVRMLNQDDCFSNFLNYDKKPKRSKISSIQHKQSIFNLENQVYLCIKLEWVKFEENVKYFNVFINKIRNLVKTPEVKEPIENGKDKQTDQAANEKKVDLSYIGSSKIENFLICLKLNENVKIDPTHASNDTLLSFNLIIQAIDTNLNNLEEANQIFGTNLSDNNTIKYVDIQVSKLKIKNQFDPSFLNKIIYDFESFN